MELLLQIFGGVLLGSIIVAIIAIMIACFRVSSACSREEERQELERSLKAKKGNKK